MSWHWRRTVAAALIVGACTSCDSPYGAYGVVRSRAGEPLSGASVRLESLSGSALKQTVTDREGSYSVAGATWGSLQTRLTITKRGFGQFVKELPGRHTTRVVVTLDPER
jgi:hypothetical protein